MKDCILEREEYVLKESSDGVITLRDLQLEILEITDEIDRICRKHHIPYALHAGSALGVVNYKGFIPWDDDVDIMIDVNDYKKLIKALKEDLNDKFYFQCFDTDKRYNVLISSMKIRKKGTYITEENVLLKNRCKSGDGIFVDIIWCGGASKHKLVDELFRLPIRILMPFIVLLDNIHINPIPLKYLVDLIARGYSKLFKNSGYVSQTISYPWIKFNKQPIFKRDDVFPFKNCEFEGRKYMTYHNPENVLITHFSPHCLKKWDGEKWINPYPKEKRLPKHIKDIRLK